MKLRDALKGLKKFHTHMIRRHVMLTKILELDGAARTRFDNALPVHEFANVELSGEGSESA